tara:strand:- start:2296 stop:3825 length:1530 start_codon:yes stop_codon:yes gene_type:complete
MRRRDKSKSIERANKLAEQRHLESKGEGAVNESGMAHAAGFADGGSGFEEGVTEMKSTRLPYKFYGKPLTLTDSNGQTWETSIKNLTAYSKSGGTNIRIGLNDKPNNIDIKPDGTIIINGLGASNQMQAKVEGESAAMIDTIRSIIAKQQDDTINESPWNGDPNSNWVPGDDDIEVEVHEWRLDFERTEDTDKYPDDHILVSVNAASGGQQWNTEVELSSFIPRKEGEKYAPLVQQLINLNGGKDYKVSDDQLFKNPKTKEIANILDGLISDFADSYDVDYGDPYPDEDLMPGGKYDRMDEGAVNKSGIKKSSKRIKITESQRSLLKSKGLLKENAIDEVLVGNDVINPNTMSAIMAAVPMLVGLSATVHWKEEIVDWLKGLAQKDSKLKKKLVSGGKFEGQSQESVTEDEGQGGNSVDRMKQALIELSSEIEKINPKSPTIQYVKDKILDDKKYKVTYGGPGKPVGEYEMTFADLISKAWEGKIKKGLEQWNDYDWKQIYDYIKMKEK